MKKQKKKCLESFTLRFKILYISISSHKLPLIGVMGKKNILPTTYDFRLSLIGVCAKII